MTEELVYHFFVGQNRKIKVLGINHKNSSKFTIGKKLFYNARSVTINRRYKLIIEIQRSVLYIVPHKNYNVKKIAINR